jgi:hypothetical protein
MKVLVARGAHPRRVGPAGPQAAGCKPAPRGDQWPARRAGFDAEGKVFSAFALEIFDGRVQSVRSVVNPDKLRHLGDVADMRAVLKTRDH